MHINSRKMADGVDIDLYADDLDQGFPIKDEFNDDVDLYDDVIAAPSSEPHERSDNATPASQIDRSEIHESNGGFSHIGNNMTQNHIGRRHQLYVGNLTWWTTDQDINDVCHEIGVSDFQDVKFFENRSNGQSKGFCLISLASESSMRLCMDRLPKKDLHGQSPVVTLPTKQALNQFESQQKTRPVPPTTNGPGPRVPGPGLLPSGPPQSSGYQSTGHQPRMMNPNGPPQYRPHNMQQQSMQGPPGPNQGPPRMQPPQMHQGGPMGGPQSQQQGPPRYQTQNQWNGPPRQNGPPRPGPPNGPPGPPQHRPMYQGGPPGPGGMQQRGPRPDWNRPPMHGGFQQGPPGPGGHQQGPPHMQGPPRGPPPPQMGGPGGPPHGPPQGPAPHVNPAFFNQGGGPPQHGGPPLGPPHGPPQNMSSHGPPSHFQPQGGPRGPWPGPQVKPVGPPSFPDQGLQPQLSEIEFEEIMTRNRTVSSSAIARAVSDAAAGEYSSAIETLVTAISLIKQSKVAHDERCKILISSLQDTLHGIESKSYSRRDRSRSRDRSHRRPRRERSTSRSYRERSRERERERDREREREGGSRHYSESYRESARGDGRDRSRSRGADRGSERGGAGGGSERGAERGSERGADRSGGGEHYREESHLMDSNMRGHTQAAQSNSDQSSRSRTAAAAIDPHVKLSSSSRSARTRKSQEPTGDAANDTSKRNYYDERYRSSDRDRDREREHRSRH